MAPTSRNSSRKQQKNGNDNKTKPRKEVSFTKREPLRRNSVVAAKPQENFENLILYYLTKLKNLFANPNNHPTPGKRENSGEKMRRELLHNEKATKSKLEINPNKYISRQSTPKPRNTLQDNEIRDKIYDVVSAAIEYGYRNNIIERKGNYFLLRNKKNPKLANRQATPGPGISETRVSVYAGCNCNRCKTMNSEAMQQDPPPMTSESMYYDSPIRDFCQGPQESTNCFPFTTDSVLPKSKSCTFGVASACPLKERPKKSCRCRKCLLANKKRNM